MGANEGSMERKLTLEIRMWRAAVCIALPYFVKGQVISCSCLLLFSSRSLLNDYICAVLDDNVGKPSCERSQLIILWTRGRPQLLIILLTSLLVKFPVIEMLLAL